MLKLWVKRDGWQAKEKYDGEVFPSSNIQPSRHALVHKWFIFISSFPGSGWWWLLCVQQNVQRDYEMLSWLRTRTVSTRCSAMGRAKLFDDCQRRPGLFEFKFLYAFIDGRATMKETKISRSYANSQFFQFRLSFPFFFLPLFSLVHTKVESAEMDNFI